MAKKTKSYVGLRTEPGLNIGNWNGQINQGQVYEDLPADVVEALVSSGVIEDLDTSTTFEEVTDAADA
jgi:hypothetical protein